MATWNEHYTFNTGAKIPAVGLGTWLSSPGQVRDAVKIALQTGYRHIDAAAIYENENEVGQGIKDSGVPRSEIFLTSKLWNNSRATADVEKALDDSLKKLDTPYLDLYLIHWPVAFASGDNRFPQTASGTIAVADIPISKTWAALEALVETGKIRAIGVSNFNQRKIEDLLTTAKIVPAVNQIEAHPWLQQNGLKEFLTSKGIHITAYSPLGNNVYGKPRVLDDPSVKEVARQAGATVAQALVSWAVGRGTSVVPKSITADRIASNFEKIALSSDAREKLDSLDKDQRYNDPIEWGVDTFELRKPDSEEVKAATVEYARTHPVKA